MRKIESLGAKVVYDAPLPTVPEVVGKYKTVQMLQIASECYLPNGEPISDLI